MRFATIAHINDDSTVDITYGPDNTATGIATINGYTPIQHEMVIVADVDGTPVCMGSTYNLPEELT